MLLWHNILWNISFDIFDKNPERLATILAENCRKRRLDKDIHINRKRCIEIIEEIEHVCDIELDIDKIVKIKG